MADAKETQIIEPFVLFDNLAEGALIDTDEGIQEWADQHGLDIVSVAEDNRKHLRDAVSAARQQISERQSADSWPEEVSTTDEAREVFAALAPAGFAIASRNAKNLSGHDEIRQANTMLKLHRKSSKAQS